MSERTRSASVAVVIPTHDRCDYLRAMLDVLLEDPATTEVVVVADGCRDGTVPMLESAARSDPRIRTVVSNGLGAAGARQLGAEHATADLLLFLDDDVIPSRGLVSAHRARHTDVGDDRVVLVGHMPTRPPATPRPSSFANRLYAEEYEAHVRRWEGGEDPLLRLWAGHLSIHRGRALEAGLVDHALPLKYHEDTGLGLRLRSTGMRAVFDRRLHSEHQHERGVAQFLRIFYEQGYDRALLQRHHEASGEPGEDLDDTLEGLPMPLEWLIRAGGTRRSGRAVEFGLSMLVRLADLVSSEQLAVGAARLARRMVMRRGRADARAGRARRP